MDMETRLVILGDPVSKGRPRFTRYGKTYTPKRTADAEKLIKDTAIAAGVPCRDEPLEVSFRFYCATKRRTDASNLAKLTEDALNGVAWTDDYLIEHLDIRLFRATPNETPRTEIVIRSL